MGMDPSSEDYYPTVVINALMKILRDPPLSAHHTAVIQAVMHIFKTLSLKCVPFLPQVCYPLTTIKNNNNSSSSNDDDDGASGSN